MEAGDEDREDSKTSLLFRSDFGGFEQLESRDRWVHVKWSSVVGINWKHTSPQYSVSGGSSEVDSDVEDAIYAHMYFDEFRGAQEASGEASYLRLLKKIMVTSN